MTAEKVKQARDFLLVACANNLPIAKAAVASSKLPVNLRRLLTIGVKRGAK